MSESICSLDTLRGYTVGEVAEKLGICARTIYREIAKGNLRCLRFGRAVRITDSQLAEFLRDREG